MGARVTSEIGPLRAVLVHTPGAELLGVTPGTRETYLYDDILDMRSPIDSLEEGGKALEMFPAYSHEFMRNRIARKIFNRCIAGG